MIFKKIEDFAAFTELSQRCYPGMKLNSKEEKERYAEHRKKMAKEETIRNLGLYEDNTLIGAYIEYDHLMNVYGRTVAAAGIGTVAVDLPYKKQGHARRIVSHFLRDAKENGRTLAHLYPFQPTFYKRMGFGIGPALSTYRFHPSQLPSYGQAHPVKVLGKKGKEKVRSCYHRWAQQTHGATEMEAYGFGFLEKEELHTVGVEKDGEIEGYVTFEFKEGEHFLQNDLYVRNFFYTTPESYRALIQYLHNQKDQVHAIYFPTFDQDFSFMLENPIHTDKKLIHSIYHKVSEQGYGLMYRIVDIPKFLDAIKHYSFGSETVRIGWKVNDTLLDEKYEQVWQFTEGKPSLTDQPAEVSIHLDIGNFSSLLMGCVKLASLLKSGAIELDGRANLDLFQNPQVPECWTFF